MRDGRDLARTGLTPYPSDMTEHLDPALVDTWFAAWSRSRGYRISQEAGRRAALRTPRPARMIPGGSGRATVDVPATWEHVVVNPSRGELEDLREAVRDQEQILLTVFGDAGEDPKAMGLKAQAEPERFMTMDMDPELQDVEPPLLPEGYEARVDQPMEGSRRLRILAVGASTVPEGEEELAALGWVTEEDGTAVYDRIWTSPNHRRRGLGSLVMRYLTSEVMSEGEISRGLLVASPDGQKLYRHLAWTDLGPVSIWGRGLAEDNPTAEHTGTMGA